MKIAADDIQNKLKEFEESLERSYRTAIDGLLTRNFSPSQIDLKNRCWKIKTNVYINDRDMYCWYDNTTAVLYCPRDVFENYLKELGYDFEFEKYTLKLRW